MLWIELILLNPISGENGSQINYKSQRNQDQDVSVPPCTHCGCCPFFSTSLALAGRLGGGVSGLEATSLNMSPAGTDFFSSSGSDGSYTVEALLVSKYTFSTFCLLLFMRLS